ncbi:MAG TPA: MFS transporter [Candidatus Pseudogracilibacillus intestinigallinarum]|uniref:MFS transporter n=1 Tax=Candidatus Pseudogracilibacillus intestinigallinarum TaxID=2838742 RepID=A0A9D1PNY8_9BACI|nr:MFS transporter [Candidatus Pseudogracilibacillus intestinigallinarum]
MNRIMYIIIIVAFLDTFIQLPIITPYAIELDASYILAGAIVAVYSFTNMIGNIIGGHWIDKFGRKKMLFTGMVAVSVVLFLYPLSQNGWQLFIARFFHGLAGGVLIPAAFAYIGDHSGGENRGKKMAFTGAGIGIAAIVGPAVGGVLAARASIEAVFLLVAVLFLITSLIVLFFVKESYVATDRGKFNFKEFIPLIKHPMIILSSVSAFGLMISNGTLAFALPLNVELMKLSTETTGMLLSTFGIMALIVFLTPLNFIYDKFSPVHLIATGLGLIGVGMIILSVMATFMSNFIAMVIYGLGFAFIFPSMNKIIADASTKVDRGKAYGVFYAFFSLGVVAGSSVSGVFAETAGLPFLACAIIMFIVIAIIIILNRKAKVTL